MKMIELEPIGNTKVWVEEKSLQKTVVMELQNLLNWQEVSIVFAANHLAMVMTRQNQHQPR